MEKNSKQSQQATNWNITAAMEFQLNILTQYGLTVWIKAGR